MIRAFFSVLLSMVSLKIFILLHPKTWRERLENKMAKMKNEISEMKKKLGNKKIELTKKEKMEMIILQSLNDNTEIKSYLKQK